MSNHMEFKSPRGQDELTLIKQWGGAVVFETVNGDSEDVHVVYLDRRQVLEIANLLHYWRRTGE